jgi:PKHD-type hydroxylase
MRADIDITIFLSDPATYDGGELVVDSDTIPKPVKLPAGDAILYPANTVHRVETVTRGVRVAAVTWIQSLIPDPAQRQILFDMMMVKDFLATDQTPQTLADAQLRATKTYVSLIQMWART